MSRIAMDKFKIEYINIRAINKSINKYSKLYNIPKSLVYAVIERESSFNHKLISKSECVGLMQINYKVWKKELNIPSVEYLHNIENNIKCGCYILNKYFKMTGDYGLALQRYFGLSKKAHKYSISVLKIQERYLGDKNESN
jgi:soluble lytic murein transglycosylase-like protein